jgi:tetratricopeptide (TPR) repeat protein
MMRKLGNSPMGRIQIMLLPWLFLVFFSGTGMARNAVIQHITIQDNPLSVRFDMTKKVPVKVIQIESKEVLIALQNVSLARNIKVTGRDLPGIKEVNIESLQGDVVAVVIITRSSQGPVASGFNAAGLQFVVSMSPHKSAMVKKNKQAAAPEKTREKPAQTTDSTGTVPDREPVLQGTSPLSDQGYISLAPDGTLPAAPADDVRTPPDVSKTVKIPTPPLYVPPQREKSVFQGDISDMGQVMASSECGSVGPINNALGLIERTLYQQAFDLLDQYLAHQNTTCLEQVYYLRAYAFYKSIAKDDFALLIKAERMFQDALVLYHQSAYVPFAYTAIGMIHMDLNNLSAAEGYFNIVMQGYEDYPGRPEVLFHLAEIFDEKGYVDKALELYQQVFEVFAENAYLVDAGIGYGRALFKKHQYYTALSVFNHVVAQQEKKIYEAPDLLRYMGDANFELSLSKPARDNYMRLMNLFEEIADKDVLLSRVGDTYGMENSEKKAVKIYELVRERFPDSQGYVTASMGLARYLDTDAEKIDIYEMIKNRFPENTYARIAMMRLAEIYQKNGEYDKCIKEIEDLLSTHPRGLQYEAVKLMQEAYEALFEKQLKENDYPAVLNRYESEYSKIDRMDSRKIAFSVGTAYLQAALFEEAFNHLLNAYKQYKRAERSAELLFYLGVAMDETGRDDDALTLLEAFSKQFKTHEGFVDAMVRTGDIHLSKKQYARADAGFKQAYAGSKNHLEKGHILLRHAEVFAQQNDLTAAARLLAAAVKDFAAAPGKNYEILTHAYKTLGNTYISLTSYVQAADAFSKALDFSDGERLKANLGFLLGDAYQKGNILPKARAAFEQVADTYDSVWARLARQRLTTLELARTVSNS